MLLVPGIVMGIIVGACFGIWFANFVWMRHADTGRPIEPQGGRYFTVAEVTLAQQTEVD